MTQNSSQNFSFRVVLILAHALALLPLAHLIFAALTGGLTVNPIQYVEQRLGDAAIAVLTADLAVNPAVTITGWHKLSKLARPLGLYAFGYAFAHFLVFIGLDFGFSGPLLWQELREKPFILLGLSALILLAALAITSFKWWMRRLGRNWKRLHRLVYVAGILVVIHYGLALKGDFFHLRGNELLPLLYAVVILILLAMRIPWVKRRLKRR
ncbi:protein-methionine-sulfoxide reductase heme-binding subunit MsrQ [Longilinea arvoryzae]|uniref:sulfite oxidase heme-binding subunit YedZ n=1 Tax=Longilinea arvoryzae TaxID=360412 RepID=UPI00155FC692|nr:protein-methionine-sulfoxide reductase heme-binding subunit MsrQ [Longilinea arvoryzae]